MIIKIKTLNQAIKRINKLIANSTSLEITRSIRLIQSKDKLRIEVSNFCAYGSVTIPNTGDEEEYRFLLESLTPLLRDIPQDEIIELTGNTDIIKVRYNGGHAKIKAIDPNISLINTHDKAPSGRIKAGVLADMIDRVVPFVSRNMSEIAKAGICLDIKDGLLSLIGTDGARLSVQRTPIQSEDKRVVISTQYLGVFSSMFDTDEEVDITITPSFIIFSNSRGILGNSLIQANYPDYNKVMKSLRKTTEIKCNVNELSAILRRSYYFAPIFTLKAVIRAKGNSLTIEARNYDYHKYSEENISVIKTGPDMQLGIKISFLLSALSLIRSEDVRLHLDSPERAILVTEDNKDQIESFYIIMPMQLRED